MHMTIFRSALVGFAAIASAAMGAAPSCTLPANIPAARSQKPGDVRNTPTTGYLLSLSWSPEACFNAKRNPRNNAQDSAIQCGSNAHFAFVLHGLWPEGAADQQWPQYCRTVPPVSAATVRANLCRTPSVGLIEHEWEKHGSCGWQTAEAYFAQSAKLMDRLKLPDISGLTRSPVNASAIRAAFVAANPDLPRAAIGVAANKSGWFEEVRLCLDTAFKYRACPAYSIGSADGDRLKVARLK